MTASSETLKSFLIRTPFFGGLSDTALDRIIAMLVERKYASGATVFNEGDTGRSMYVIGKGEIVMSRAGESGHQVKLVRLHEGDFFGETTLIEMQPRPYTATVATDTTLYELTNVDLYKLYHADVKAYVLVLQNINRELCRRVRKADTRITEIADETKDDITQIGSSFRKSNPPTKR
jgi:CRP/FNR family transcriptional regulator, cyclic AMP receptor protein